MYLPSSAVVVVVTVDPLLLEHLLEPLLEPRDLDSPLCKERFYYVDWRWFPIVNNSRTLLWIMWHLFKNLWSLFSLAGVILLPSPWLILSSCSSWHKTPCSWACCPAHIAVGGKRGKMYRNTDKESTRAKNWRRSDCTTTGLFKYEKESLKTEKENLRFLYSYILCVPVFQASQEIKYHQQSKQ